MYNGVTDPEGNLLRYSLEDAASKVGVSKKSLDDYLLQLRFGKKFGFDFQKHKDDKVGVLRTHVKSHKEEQKKGPGKIAKGTPKPATVTKKGARKAPASDDEASDDSEAELDHEESMEE